MVFFFKDFLLDEEKNCHNLVIFFVEEDLPPLRNPTKPTVLHIDGRQDNAKHQSHLCDKRLPHKGRR